MSGAKEVTDGMLQAAAEALPAAARAEDLATGSIFPHVSDIRAVSSHVAAAVIREAFTEGLAGETEVALETKALFDSGASNEALAAFALSSMFVPRYVPLVAAPASEGEVGAEEKA